jgi:hypothetical protein
MDALLVREIVGDWMQRSIQAMNAAAANPLPAPLMHSPPTTSLHPPPTSPVHPPLATPLHPPPVPPVHPPSAPSMHPPPIQGDPDATNVI